MRRISQYDTCKIRGDCTLCPTRRATMDDQSHSRFSRLLTFLITTLLLAGCTKFHFPEPVLPEAPAESAPKQEVPEPFTPEELGEIVSANLIENVDVDMSEEGIRFTWIEDEPREPAQYWILVSTDGEEFEPIHKFHIDEAAHISTLSTFMTFSVNPEDDADVLELLQGILSAGYERHETPIIDPVSGQLHLPPSLFDNYEMDPADVESIIQQMQNH